jgi:archaellum component FlaC
MISEKAILSIKKDVARLKSKVEELGLNIELLEHHCEDYEKFLDKEGSCTDEFLSDYAGDIQEFIDDIEKNVEDVDTEAMDFLEGLIK